MRCWVLAYFSIYIHIPCFDPRWVSFQSQNQQRNLLFFPLVVLQPLLNQEPIDFLHCAYLIHLLLCSDNLLFPNHILLLREILLSVVLHRIQRYLLISEDSHVILLEINKLSTVEVLLANTFILVFLLNTIMIQSFAIVH